MFSMSTNKGSALTPLRRADYPAYLKALKRATKTVPIKKSKPNKTWHLGIIPRTMADYLLCNKKTLQKAGIL
jgi:hypothetical protein